MLIEQRQYPLTNSFRERKLSVISRDVLADLGMTPGQIRAYGAFGAGPVRRSTDEDRRVGALSLA
ncbi:hypothetical protein [Phenylobacterium sp.]|uniref:hypothetical protein n=1 Tax=Phenylobacterium sp. TaxID=1871053 RepID=UPI0030F414B5